MTIDEIILEELRAFRAQVQPWMLDVESRVSVLEAQCLKCSAEKSDVEERLVGVEHWHWTVAGACGAFAGILTAISIAVKYHVRFF